jgi:hypothetical protein
VQSEVPVAEPEPSLAAERLHRLECMPRLVRTAPATLVVGQIRQCVEDAVEVGRGEETEDLDVVADVDDRRDARRVDDVDEAA